ncbi:MAG: 16S rRNA C967 or C1407 C5-methylase (RsmB/RsmF family) [Bacteroidia bacterium]|jgi:16S rRNA C967 or C1407 C5-methylase (RsmB/RsmF family)
MVRQLAWEILRSGSETPLREVDFASEQVGLSPRDRGLLRRIVGTEVRHRATLRAIVNRYARGNPKADLRAHLHVALAQIFYLDRVPHRAAVSEAGDATRRTLGPSKVPYVNAILRTVLRERRVGSTGDPMCDIYGTNWHLEEPLYPDPKEHPLLWIEEALSIPSVLAKRWVKRYGFERTVELAKYFSAEPALSLRVHGDRDAVRAELEAHLAADLLEQAAAAVEVPVDGAVEAPVDGASDEVVEAPVEVAVETPVDTSVDASAKPAVDDAIYGSSYASARSAVAGTVAAPAKANETPQAAPTRLLDGAHPQFILVDGANQGALFHAAAFTEGRITVQGEHAFRAASLMQAAEGEELLDLCAAPGGKTAVMAAAGARVTACDVSEKKLARLGETIARLGLEDLVECIELDAEATPSDAALGERDFDGVFVDAPCSNTGVIGARAGARWRFGKANQASLRELQAKLLAQGAARVRPGGKLVWSTCSLESDENIQQIKAFLETNPDWTIEEELESMPKWPSHGGPIDGGYSARLRRGN